MFELLFLLLPVAAAYGYYMGRNSYKNKRADLSKEQTSNYLQGVDYLLNNDKDQAVEKFIAYLNSSDPTFESTLALGNLFRTRGEVDRAISLHTSLANNDTLEPHECELAQLELAQDFMSAGLLDRAEQILLDLVDIPRQRQSAVQLLVKVYEQERDFDKALEVGEQDLEVLNNSSLNRLCNYHCEIAQSLMVSTKFKEASHHVNKAKNLMPKSIRPLIIEAEISIRESRDLTSDKEVKEYKKHFLKLIETIIENDNQSSYFVLELLHKAYGGLWYEDEQNIQTPIKTGFSSFLSSSGLSRLTRSNSDTTVRLIEPQDPKYYDLLESLVAKTKSAAAIVELCIWIFYYKSPSDAEQLLLNYLKEKPNLQLFSLLMGMRSKGSSNKSSKESESILNLKGIIDAQLAATPHFNCSRCGFDSSMMFWQCPSCRRWDTMRTKRGIDSD